MLQEKFGVLGQSKLLSQLEVVAQTEPLWPDTFEIQENCAPSDEQSLSEVQAVGLLLPPRHKLLVVSLYELAGQEELVPLAAIIGTQ